MSNRKDVEFSDTQAKEMAIFLAELTRQGIAYNVVTIIGGWKIELTGF